MNHKRHYHFFIPSVFVLSFRVVSCEIPAGMWNFVNSRRIIELYIPYNGTQESHG